jgi:hypothetical protein
MMSEHEFKNMILSIILFVLLLGNMLIFINWIMSYNLNHSDWKCTEEVQVGDDITHHECITYKRNQVK